MGWSIDMHVKARQREENRRKYNTFERMKELKKDDERYKHKEESWVFAIRTIGIFHSNSRH